MGNAGDFEIENGVLLKYRGQSGRVVGPGNVQRADTRHSIPALVWLITRCRLLELYIYAGSRHKGESADGESGHLQNH